MRTIPALAILTLTLGACTDEAPPRPSAGEGDGGVRALCTFDPPGSGPVHRQLDEQREMVRKLPKKLDAWIVLGRTWVQVARNDADPGWYLHAKACAEVGLELEPENLLSLELIALALGNDHAFVEQKAMAERILRKDPDDLLALGALADASLELGDVDGAEIAVQRMIDRKPNLPSYARAAHLAWLRGDIDASLESWRLAFDAGRGQRDPEPQAWVLTEAAHVFFHKGDVEGARTGYQTALVLKPDFAPALVGLARCDLAERDAVRATERLERAIATGPSPEALRLLADARALADDAKGADDARQRALALAKKSDPRSYAVLLALWEPSPASLATAQSLLDDEAERGDVLTHDARALVSWRKGDREGAKASITAALRLGTPDASLVMHQAVILGDRALAQKALAMNPHLDAMHVDLARAAGVL